MSECGCHPSQVALLRVAGQHPESEEVPGEGEGDMETGRLGCGKLELSYQGMMARQKGVFADSVLSVLPYLRPGGPRHALRHPSAWV